MKWKVYFQIFIIVFSIFAVYTPSVSAGQQVCCEKNRAASPCVYTTQDQCDPRFKSAATNCEQTSFCKLGCGFDVFSGRCFRNTPKATCGYAGNCTWSEGTDCNVPTCEKGCCILGSEASLTTQIACKATASKYPDVTMKFRPEITDELECINQVRSVEKGACVKPDNSCIFTTRDQCPEAPTPANPRLGFHVNLLCSNPTLQTNCAQQKYTNCLPDKDEVYWFDSCGNPENIYSSNKQISYNNGFVLKKEQSCQLTSPGDKNCGNCNFPAGTLCGLASRDQKPVYGDYTCQDLSCKPTEENLAPSSDTPKKLGESWCAFDGLVGFGNDVVGSRHFRRICINGKELQEPCRDFREEICVEGVQAQPPLGFPATFKAKGDYVEAKCRPNRFTDCLSITNKEDCEDIQNGDCYWSLIGIHPPGFKEPPGVCVPHIPPGLKFWTGDAQYVPSADAGDVCAQANQECIVTQYFSGAAKAGLASKGTKKIGLSETSQEGKCVGNCECRTGAWVDAASSICRSLGDCGFNFNVLGKPGRKEAFTETSPADPTTLNPNERVFLSKRDGKLNFGAYYGKSWSRVIPLVEIAAHIPFAAIAGDLGALVPGIYYNPVFAIGEPTHAGLSAKSYGTQAQYLTGDGLKAATSKLATEKLADESFKKAATEAATKEAAKQTFADEAAKQTFINNYIQSEAEKAAAKQLAETPATGSLGGTLISIVNFIMILWLIYQLIDIFGQDTTQETITATCSPWQAPRGGSDCEKCGKDNKPCSEYRCRSLGAQCKLVNAGTENEKCVNQNPNDVNSPRIYANATALQVGYTLSEVKNQGFTVNEKIEPFTKVSLGVSTDEPAVCRFSLEHSKSFEEMTHPFGSTFYDYSHELRFSLPSELVEEDILRLTNGGKYSIYIRCSDAAGNDNNKDYYINFEIKPGPDYTAPAIEITSVASGSYIASGVSQIPFYAYLNEPADCKWSTTDTDYNNMQNSFTCRTSGLDQRSVYYGLYECGTTLTGIKPKQVSTYYFRCKDQPLQTDDSKRNVNTESYKFSLVGTEELKILSVSPTGLIYEPSPVLEVKTIGGAQNGIAYCGFSLTGNTNLAGQVAFLETNSSAHKQPLTNIQPGDYTVAVTCVDAGGNIASTSTKFTTQTDTKAPRITQIYTEGNILKISTDEDSTCEYSNEAPFTYGQGTPMTGTLTKIHEATLIQNKPYYVSCKDKFDNTMNVQIYAK